MARIGAEPFWSMYLYMYNHWWHSNSADCAYWIECCNIFQKQSFKIIIFSNNICTKIAFCSFSLLFLILNCFTNFTASTKRSPNWKLGLIFVFPFSAVGYDWVQTRSLQRTDLINIAKTNVLISRNSKSHLPVSFTHSFYTWWSNVLSIRPVCRDEDYFATSRKKRKSFSVPRREFHKKSH